MPLQRHLGARQTVFERDSALGFGSVWLPFALARKYPAAPRSWGWQIHTHVLQRGGLAVRSPLGAALHPAAR